MVDALAFLQFSCANMAAATTAVDHVRWERVKTWRAGGEPTTLIEGTVQLYTTNGLIYLQMKVVELAGFPSRIIILLLNLLVAQHSTTSSDLRHEIKTTRTYVLADIGCFTIVLSDTEPWHLDDESPQSSHLSIVQMMAQSCCHVLYNTYTTYLRLQAREMQSA